ncbi:family 2 glycosyl transferase [Candidatus Protofrankia californiensis]|uniref:Family 2 glycosyl transferase n=1 Tax=Candidatus Protofrankia californiensis TaxID=1839754 RepID=A0A1C3NUY3_9ACTN|nr:family 2 glycosyl transferase [Candidatus Protofrankia californiensis]
MVMPCLNEEASVGICVAKAFAGIADAGLTGEVIVVDNGSADASISVALSAGARVLTESRQGYGNVCLTEFAAARGHYLGNPLLTGMLNRLFGVTSSDAHSGMRAFTRAAYEHMRPRCEGMELASELVISAARAGLRVEEVPITYHRRVGASKLRSLRDGWRHVRFMLPLAPRHLFVIPGLVLLAFGVAGQLVLLPGVFDLGFRRLDVHVCVLFAMVAVLGWQVVLLGIFADAYNRALGRARCPGPLLARAYRHFTLERGLVAGCVLFVIGSAVDGVVLGRWIAADPGPLEELRPALLAMTLTVLGAETGFASFFLHLLTAGSAAGVRGGVGSSEPGVPVGGK